MPESSGKPKPSEIDAKQRHPFLLFCFSATAFAAVLVFGDRVPLSWREGMRLLTVMIGAFGLWNFCQLITLADERQRVLTTKLCDSVSWPLLAATEDFVAGLREIPNSLQRSTICSPENAAQNLDTSSFFNRGFSTDLLEAVAAKVNFGFAGVKFGAFGS